MSLPLKVALLLPTLAVFAVWLAQRWQQRVLAEIVSTIELTAKEGRPEEEGLPPVDELPPPVARYLNHVLPTDKRRLLVARYQQAGTLRTDTQSERWMDFTASQVISPAHSEFIWDAKVSLMPLLHLRIRDALVGGHGSGQVALLSAVPVGSAGGTMEMKSGSLHRFLAEAVWYPTALLPSSSLSWAPIDDARALATLTHGTISVSLEFRFNQENEVEAIYTPGRWGAFDGGYKQVAWEGHFQDYARRDGVLVPTRGEVGWYTDGKWHAVWRGSVVSAHYEFE